ncbi:MAG: endonuclease V [Methanobacteriota archaeon]
MNLFDYTYGLVRQIPDGKISSYGAVASALGDIRASRSVGWMMNQNPDADTMPCYKLVHSDGRLGGFGLGIPDKIRRLQRDNILVKDGRIVDFERVFFNDFQTTYPLQILQKEQQTLQKKIMVTDDFDEIVTVAGVDVAYSPNAFDDACAAYVLMEYPQGKILEETTVLSKTFFPYVPTYLSYREFPIIEKLMNTVKHQLSVVLFDGNGVLHPRGCGLASHAGVVLDLPSIGVAKTPYKNLVRPENLLFLSKTSKKPVYVSPGHRVSLRTSKLIVQKVSVGRYPEPVRRAHLLAKSRLREIR